MRFLLPAAALAGLLAAGCAPLRSHQGYIIDADLVNAIQPGTDNRDSVRATLGDPSFASQFNMGDWYYVSRDSKNYGFNLPRAKEQIVIQVSFDAGGNVSAIRKSGIEQVASISPSRDKTPTLGRERSFFQELFGNIGAVGAPGMAGGQPGTGGGGRDTP